MHSEGIFIGFHPYLTEKASWKAALCRENPCSCTGSDDSQMDAPFSLANSIERGRSFGRDSHMMAESDFDFTLFIFLTQLGTDLLTQNLSSVSNFLFNN